MILYSAKRLSFLNVKRVFNNSMSIFVQKPNPITGQSKWCVENEDYDYYQEIARSSFADMLHDTDRNILYEKAIELAINKMHSVGKKAIVLDIGTGTGLLSMMAAKYGADKITACEAFKPMSKCAENIIALNGYKDKIKIIPKRSTDLKVGEDLNERCNILVTEVFDTELIGEGALSTFSHAHKYLLESDCIVIPQSATIYAQVVESPLIQKFNKLSDIYSNDGDILIQIPSTIKKCAGSAAVHDLQLSQVPINSFQTIIPANPVLNFDWSGKTPFIFTRSTISNLKAERSGLAQMVFMWWTLQMDTEGKIILTCAPSWAQNVTENETVPWRDHWMQAVYYFPNEILVNKGEELNLITSHDEYSLWFNLSKTLRITDEHYINPVCNCGLHQAFSRTRIGQINDVKRNKQYLRILEENINESSEILVLGDSFYLSLAALKFGGKKLHILDTNFISRKILNDFVMYNKLNNVGIYDSLENLQKIVDLKNIHLIIGEPYFSSSILPWDNLLFVYLLNSIKQYLKPDVKIFPKEAVINVMPVKFDDLHKIRMPLRQCQGFLMDSFDELIEVKFINKMPVIVKT